jgi:phosphatidate phosphatase APP1
MFTALLAALFTQADSPIKTDEVVIFFPTFARLDPEKQTWTLPIHGWIYEPETDSIRRRLALGMLRRALDLDENDAESAYFKQRARAFLVDNEAGKKIPIRVGERMILLDESDERGHLRGEVRLTADEAKKLLAAQKGKAGWLDFQAVLREGDNRSFPGRVQLLGDEGVSVITDIDDTIKISEVTNKKALLANTFLREYRAVPGMPEVYAKWAEGQAVFHYVSASPWQLYEFLEEFRIKAGYPAGSFHMKTFRWKDSSFLGLFQSPEKYKPAVIEPMLQAFPKRKFVLVGDSGEKDPEIYAALARKFEGQVAQVLIRDVTGEAADAERYRKCFEGIPRQRWRIFKDAKEIAGVLQDIKT